MLLRFRLRSFGLLPILLLFIAGCSSGASPSPSAGGAGGSPSAAAGEVDVTLQEWAVLPATSSTTAGQVTFTVKNTGPDDVHEFVILRSDLDAGNLPTDDTGAVNEDAEGIEVVDEIEDIPIGDTQEVTANLTPGKYVLLCNIYSAEENEAHYQMGMRTNFTVQ